MGCRLCRDCGGDANHSGHFCGVWRRCGWVRGEVWKALCISWQVVHNSIIIIIIGCIWPVIRVFYGWHVSGMLWERVFLGHSQHSSQWGMQLFERKLGRSLFRCCLWSLLWWGWLISWTRKVMKKMKKRWIFILFFWKKVSWMYDYVNSSSLGIPVSWIVQTDGIEEILSSCLALME